MTPQPATIRALASLVLRSRCERLCETGTTSKGRVIAVLVGAPTEAENAWQALQAMHTAPPSVERPEWLVQT